MAHATREPFAQECTLGGDFLPFPEITARLDHPGGAWFSEHREENRIARSPRRLDSWRSERMQDSFLPQRTLFGVVDPHAVSPLIRFVEVVEGQGGGRGSGDPRAPASGLRKHNFGYCCADPYSGFALRLKDWGGGDHLQKTRTRSAMMTSGSDQPLLVIRSL